VSELGAESPNVTGSSAFVDDDSEIALSPDERLFLNLI
jgi:hypothetical protein